MAVKYNTIKSTRGPKGQKLKNEPRWTLSKAGSGTICIILKFVTKIEKKTTLLNFIIFHLKLINYVITMMLVDINK